MLSGLGFFICYTGAGLCPMGLSIKCRVPGPCAVSGAISGLRKGAPTAALPEKSLCHQGKLVGGWRPSKKMSLLAPTALHPKGRRLRKEKEITQSPNSLQTEHAKQIIIFKGYF